MEFGLCREDGRLKAIGAGLLSAYGELQHACSDCPRHKDFDPVVTAVQKYEDDDYQPLYFVANSIQDALIKLRSVLKMNIISNIFLSDSTQLRCLAHSPSFLIRLLAVLRQSLISIIMKVVYSDC